MLKLKENCLCDLQLLVLLGSFKYGLTFNIVYNGRSAYHRVTYMNYTKSIYLCDKVNWVEIIAREKKAYRLIYIVSY
jgi:hypothetical protein